MAAASRDVLDCLSFGQHSIEYGQQRNAMPNDLLTRSFEGRPATPIVLLERVPRQQDREIEDIALDTSLGRERCHPYKAVACLLRRIGFCRAR
jgi:hypothetical protein